MACGYVPVRPQPPPSVEAVAVEAFEVHATQHRLGALISTALRMEIAASSSIRLTASHAADAVVRGEVLTVEEPATMVLSGASSPRAAMADATIVVRARLVDQTGRLLRGTGELRIRAQRGLSSNVWADRTLSDRAFRDVAERAARAVARRLFGPE